LLKINCVSEFIINTLSRDMQLTGIKAEGKKNFPVQFFPVAI
jgi:hypothetical protein